MELRKHVFIKYWTERSDPDGNVCSSCSCHGVLFILHFNLTMLTHMVLSTLLHAGWRFFKALW